MLTLIYPILTLIYAILTPFSRRFHSDLRHCNIDYGCLGKIKVEYEQASMLTDLASGCTAPQGNKYY